MKNFLIDTLNMLDELDEAVTKQTAELEALRGALSYCDDIIECHLQSLYVQREELVVKDDMIEELRQEDVYKAKKINELSDMLSSARLDLEMVDDDEFDDFMDTLRDGDGEFNP